VITKFNFVVLLYCMQRAPIFLGMFVVSRNFRAVICSVFGFFPFKNVSMEIVVVRLVVQSTNSIQL
jgi:hypothetical protein